MQQRGENKRQQWRASWIKTKLLISSTHRNSFRNLSYFSWFFLWLFNGWNWKKATVFLPNEYFPNCALHPLSLDQTWNRTKSCKKKVFPPNRGRGARGASFNHRKYAISFRKWFLVSSLSHVSRFVFFKLVPLMDVSACIVFDTDWCT